MFKILTTSFAVVFICLYAPSGANAQLFMPSTSPAEVESEINKIFPDMPIMKDIAKCESGLRQYSNNFVPLRGGKGGNYIGVFQLAESHSQAARAMGFDIYSLEGNVGYAKVMYDAQGTAPWVACTKIAPTVKKQAQAVGAQTTLTTNLQTGSVNTQVATLQKLLNAVGLKSAETGPGSPGNETTIFGALTKEALKRFQCAKNLVCAGTESTTGFGRLGPKTRAALLVI